MSLFTQLDHACMWLQGTKLSAAIASQNWIVPALQTVHILCVCLVFSSALLIGLRVVGLVGTDQTQHAVGQRFLPFVWWPLPILLLTGALLISAEPARSLENPSFWLKMSFLLGAVIVTALYQGQMRSTSPRRGFSVCLALASFILWPGIVVAARWISYTQP